ncbi:diiron oxygenase [Nocardia sp. CNY236]|uniref:AurF N-oxygenase family protein n=1 Tax=Nocardia sp. CNY236 TaxID=1169152 RepID=UPI0004057A03|nr:diiron oxygenase [Nocardia sp. CNY236]
MKPATTSTAADSEVASDEEYAEKLRLLSEGSVHRHFDPYKDVDWDNPDYAVDVGAERWILPSVNDMIAKHPWYQNLPIDQQIAIGKYRMANIVKVGQQLECVLISGMALYNYSVPNGSPEFEYCTHEMIEEHNHNLMFQEMIDRIGMDVRGLGWPLRELKFLGALMASWFPNIFFMIVVAGEEPVDHVQKQLLRSSEDIHPIVRNVMSVHLAEEARHISFAHAFLKKHVSGSSRLGKFGLSLVMPIIMRWIGYAIVVPSRAFFAEFDIPDRVRRQMFYSADAARFISDYFDDARVLANDVGLMNPVAKVVWKILRIDGRLSRHRSEPQRDAT